MKKYHTTLLAENMTGSQINPEISVWYTFQIQHATPNIHRPTMEAKDKEYPKP
jgi:hypothetical protein